MRMLVLVLATLCCAAPVARAAVIVVDTTADGISGPLCDIRDAITAANDDAPVGGCTEVDPSGDDVVDLSGLTGSIELDSLPLAALPTIQENVTIRGPGADLLRIDGLDAIHLLVVENGTLTIEGLTLANGTTGGRGGCISVQDAALVLRDARLTSCDAFNGGAIAVDDGSTARIDRSLFDANTAGNSGAAIIVSASTLEVNESTFSGNVAQQVGGAIGTFASDAPGALAPVTQIHGSTLADNGATSGAGIYNDPTDSAASTVLTHVLLAAPRNGGNCAGAAVTSEGWNLSTDATCALAATGDLTSTSAGIEATLADNGGPTATHAVLAGSAAIDAGDPAGCLDSSGVASGTDQRGVGFPRRTDGDGVAGAVCDIGAYETVPEPLAGWGAGAALVGLGCVRRRRAISARGVASR